MELVVDASALSKTFDFVGIHVFLFVVLAKE